MEQTSRPVRRRIGLTGGIGCGKSTVLGVLAEFGVLTAQADQLAKAQYERPEIRAKLAEIFGPEVLTSAGDVDKAALARIVFASPARLTQLEELLHPATRAAWSTLCAGPHPLVAIEIPLLFEKDLGSQFDVTWCVAASPATRQARLHARGWSDAQIAQREARQWTVAQKMQKADAVIWNEGSLDHLRAQVARLLSAA